MRRIQKTLTAFRSPDAPGGRQILLGLLLGVLAAFSFASSLVAQPYTPPANERVDMILDPGWRFIRQDVSGAQGSNFDDSAWSVINLPHTWNNLDGQDGGNNYYRGMAGIGFIVPWTAATPTATFLSSLTAPFRSRMCI